MKARRLLLAFINANNLDPEKDYSKHPKYGKEYKRLMLTFQIERDKVLIDYPNKDIKNRKKYYKMKKDKKKKAAAAEKTVKVEKVAKVKKAKVERTCKYNYPKIDGREMTSDEKKKYRAEQRKAANGSSKPKSEKKAKDEKKPKKSDKKDKKVDTKKKVKKVED